MEKTECTICSERHHENMDCISILKGHLHLARKRHDEMAKEKDDLELVYSALKHASV